jgi:hypothetical protein
MQLKAQDRREFIENLLDLQVFSVMNSLLKDKVKSNTDKTIIINQARAVVLGKIGIAKKNIADKMRGVTVEIEDKQRKITALTEEAAGFTKMASDLKLEAEAIVVPKFDQPRWSKLIAMKGTLKGRRLSRIRFRGCDMERQVVQAGARPRGLSSGHSVK